MSQITGFTIGAPVRARGSGWTVVEQTPFVDCTLLRLSGSDPDNAGVTRTLLVPFDRPSRVETPAGPPRFVGARRWLHIVRRAGLRTHPFGGLAAAASTRIQFLPYQLEPALAFLRHGATRVLIADAVGLGKTVQAGLLLNELAAERDTFRALVLLPAGLRDQWASELSAHFSLVSIDADAAWLARMGHELPADVNPWTLAGIHLASFDFLKRPEVLQPLEDAAWDLLVVDEAHAATLATARRAAVHAVALRSRRVLLLTATPHAGDRAQFEALCRIGAGDPDDTRPIIFTRTRADAGRPTSRRSLVLVVHPTEAERRMHALLDRYARRLCREARCRGHASGRLVAIVLRKRALSSAASLAASTTRRLALLDLMHGASEHQLLLPLADDGEEAIDDGEPDGLLAAPGFGDVAAERRHLTELLVAARLASAAESKRHRLLRLLARRAAIGGTGDPAIVFTEYRDTLTRLAAALTGAGHQPLTLHGGMPGPERSSVQRAFNRDGRLLLATDAAAEGLNLHARCRTVVHYELPWNPIRLEQRVGRVDRLGQTRTVHEIALVADTTAERIVLAPLTRRAAQVRADLRHAPGVGMIDRLAESQVVDAILDRRPVRMPSAAAAPLDTSEVTIQLARAAEARVEAARLEEQRRWHAASARLIARRRRSSLGVAATIIRRRGRPLTLTAVYLLSCTGPDGRIVHQEIVAGTLEVVDLEVRTHLVAENGIRVDPGATRRTVESLLQQYGGPLRSFVAASCADRLDEARRHLTCRTALLARREQIVAGTLSSAARHLVQAGLFDRRALHAQARRLRAAAVAIDAAGATAPIAGERGPVVTIDLSAVLLRVPR